MISIWKYKLDKIDTEIDLPPSAKFRYVAFQHHHFHIWVELDRSHPLVTRTIRMVPTGGNVMPNMRFIQTAMTPGETGVYHFYELMP